jgi:hypothetical protein
VISRYVLQGLSDDYDHALRLADDIAAILDADAPLAGHITGHHGPASTHHLMSLLSDLCVGLRQAVNTIDRATVQSVPERTP